MDFPQTALLSRYHLRDSRQTYITTLKPGQVQLQQCGLGWTSLELLRDFCETLLQTPTDLINHFLVRSYAEGWLNPRPIALSKKSFAPCNTVLTPAEPNFLGYMWLHKTTEKRLFYGVHSKLHRARVLHAVQRSFYLLRTQFRTSVKSLLARRSVRPLNNIYVNEVDLIVLKYT
ncbi:hypothetical protein D3C72_1157780 [compost metagenome]